MLTCTILLFNKTIYLDDKKWLIKLTRNPEYRQFDNIDRKTSADLGYILGTSENLETKTQCINY
ncbi:hypothetical protein Hanom_Chr03g00236621 [Helianthus anomalus]